MPSGQPAFSTTLTDVTHDYGVVRRRTGARVKEGRVGPDNVETRIRAEHFREEN